MRWDRGTTLHDADPSAHAPSVNEGLLAMLTSDIVCGFDEVRRKIGLLGGQSRTANPPGACLCAQVGAY